MRHIFSFDGSSAYTNKKGEPIVQYDSNGVSGKEAFFHWDSNGIIMKTRHPNILQSLLKTKGSVNLHIKMYVEDLAECNMSKIEFRALCIAFGAPDWFRNATFFQKIKIMNKK